MFFAHIVHWSINLSSRTTPLPIFCQAKPLNIQHLQAPFLGNPLYILVFRELPPLKIGMYYTIMVLKQLTSCYS